MADHAGQTPGQIPAALQQQLQQLQLLNQQYQQVVTQRAQVEAMQAEQAAAVEALEALAEDAAVYRNVGSLLVREPSRKHALDRLKEDQETMQLRLQRMQKQEAAAKEQLSSLQQKIQAQIPRA